MKTRIEKLTAHSQTGSTFVRAAVSETTSLNDDQLRSFLKEHSDMRIAFRVFKAGSTLDGPVAIVYSASKEYNVEKKRAFYEWMGYTVTNVNL